MKITVTYESVLDSIHAHTALLSAGARHRDTRQVPAILHSDHNPALRRVTEDAAAVVCARLAAAGVAGLTADIGADALTVETTGGCSDPAQAELASRVLRQAMKYTVLHIAYRAAGLPDDFLARAEEALGFFPSVPATGSIAPWP